MSDLRGRFAEPVDPSMRAFASSLGTDLQMFEEDIDGSMAHAEMLGRVGLLGADEADRLQRGLEQIREEFRSGDWRPDDEYEDIHMAVESRLVQLVGELGKKLHTARSRNDQVATDVRLWLKRRLARLDASVAGLIGVMLERVMSDGRTLIPGYTHLQRGQPIFLGHQLLAHAWALSRDRQRFGEALSRLDRCPLGAGAMAGTPHPIDRRQTARRLGFTDVADNAMDAVAARDHEQEVGAACAICMTGLSRMAEELVLWSSAEFSLVRIADAFATGSSIMPQKRNPDSAELIRGKAARVQADLQALLGVARSLPMAYNRDLQETREPLFSAVDTTLACLQVLTGTWRTLEVNRSRFDSELRGDFSLATELADHLVDAGVPFREAHEIVGSIVRWCEERGSNLTALTPESAGQFHPALAADLESLLDPFAAAERRTSWGGTAWPEITRQVDLLRRSLPV